MKSSWKEHIYLQREQLAQILDQPILRLSEKCAPVWGDQEKLNQVLLEGFNDIPYCKYLYCLDINAIQICDNVGSTSIVEGHFQRNRSDRPYMQETVPIWGFLLSDAYISLSMRRPSITALRMVTDDDRTLGYLGADFDLRNLPVTSALYDEPGFWRQIKGDPAVRAQVFHQKRIAWAEQDRSR